MLSLLKDKNPQPAVPGQKDSMECEQSSRVWVFLQSEFSGTKRVGIWGLALGKRRSSSLKSASLQPRCRQNAA